MQLNNGEVPIFEPGLAAMVKKAKRPVTSALPPMEAAVHYGEFQLIAVGCPLSARMALPISTKFSQPRAAIWIARK
jgi:UDP-glucose 6-dehydrogenase